MAIDKLLISAGFGFFGGVVRSVIGILKAGVLKGKTKFRWSKLVFTIVASGVIGAFSGMLFEGDYKVAMLAGYGGTDLLEGLYKAKRINR